MTDSQRQALNYLGYRGSDGDAQILAKISEAQEELIKACGEVKSVTGIWSCTVERGAVNVGGKCIRSLALADHVAGAKFICLFAVTLGVQADMLISRYSVTDMGRSVITDATASVMVNEYCRSISDEVAADPTLAGLRATKRFSPGFGDFGLRYQRDVLSLLNAGRRIGLTVTEGNMLVPTKSVTAAIGFVE